MTLDSSLTVTACFMIGLMSTLHCWAMCGGISTLLSFGTNAQAPDSRSKSVMTAVFYNTGRIFSYGVIGLMIGLMSSATIQKIFAGNGHLYLQLLSSCLLILIALHILGWFSKITLLEKIGSGLWGRVQRIAKLFLPIDSLLKAFIVGSLWGWLPCGMVYSVLLLAATAEEPVVSMVYMLAFGMGTLPGMMMASLASQGFRAKLDVVMIRYVFGTLIILLALYAPLMHLNSGEMDHSDHMHHHNH